MDNLPETRECEALLEWKPLGHDCASTLKEIATDERYSDLSYPVLLAESKRLWPSEAVDRIWNESPFGKGRNGCGVSAGSGIGGFPLYSLQDLQSYEPDPNDYIAGDGFFRRGAGCLLIGGTGVGKSVLVMQVAVSIAGGLPVLGQIAVREPRRVLYVQAENDADTLKRNLCASCGHLGADKALVESNLGIAHVYCCAGKEFTDWLADAAADTNPDLIIIDPYQAFVGDVEMNSSSSFLGWIQPIDRILFERGCALLLVAHESKSGQSGYKANPLHGVYSATGTSALANWVRSSWELSTVGSGTQRFSLKMSKNPERTGWVDSHTGQPVRQTYVERSRDPTIPFWVISENQSSAGGGKYDNELAEYYRENPNALGAQAADTVGCDKSTVSRYLVKHKSPSSGQHQ